MADAAPWPKALEAWEPELRCFARELVGHLASMGDRLTRAVGPLRAQAECASDELSGFAGLSRRGPYDRLLVSEWALQLEHEDEFIRRATSGEHLFVELDRRAPAATSEAWLFLDTGPSQLGAPRIAQLAALVAFCRRARVAGLTLRWAPLSQCGLAPHEGLTPRTVEAWLEARTVVEPAPSMLDPWLAQWPAAPGLARDVWLIGGAAVAPLAAAHGFGSMVIDDGAEDGSALELQVKPGRARARALRLALPDGPSQVRLFRSPFGWASPPPEAPPRPRGGQSTPVSLHPKTELEFSHDGHRLLARTEEGSVAAIPVRNSTRAPHGWPKVATLPNGTTLVAVSWRSRRQCALVVARQDTGAIHFADWQGRLGVMLTKDAPRAEPHELFVAPVRPQVGWEVRGRWFDAEAQRLDEHLLAARASEANAVGLMRGPVLGHETLSTGRRVFTVPTAPERVWLAGAGASCGACQLTDRLEVLTVLGVEARVDALPLELFGEDDLMAVAPASSREETTLISVHHDGRTVRALKPFVAGDRWTTVARARAPIEALTVSEARQIAWRDANGEVAVFSWARQELVLRLDVGDATRERP